MLRYILYIHSQRAPAAVDPGPEDAAAAAAAAAAADLLQHTASFVQYAVFISQAMGKKRYTAAAAAAAISIAIDLAAAA